MTTASDSRPRLSSRTIAILLVVAATVPFVSALRFRFVLDDTWIFRNTVIHGWSSLLTLWGQPYLGASDTSHAGLYRPLLMLPLALIWNAGLRAPFWFHLYVIALHAIATSLVWRVLRRATTPGAALIATLWFAVQPLHIEAVANVANSSEVLVTIATLLLVLHVARVDWSLTVNRRASWRTACVGGLLYAAALLSKESGVMAPVLAGLALWGWRTPEDGSAPSVRALWHRWWPLAVTCGVALAIIVCARIVVLGAPVSATSIAAPGLEGLSAWSRTWAMLSLGPTVLRLLVWPRTLNPHYGPSAFEGHTGINAPALAFLAAIALSGALAWQFARRGDRRVAASLLWIAVAFLPASNLLTPTGQILAERTLYLPSVGVVMLVAVVGDYVVARVARPGVILGASAAALALVLVAARITTQRIGAWGTHEKLFHQMIVADPAGYRGYWLSGLYAQNNGKPDSALALYGEAYARYRRDRKFLIEYAELLLERGQTARAAEVAGALMSWPDLRRRPEAVSLYLTALGRAYGPDSVRVAQARLASNAP